MPLISLITDLGNDDYYAALIKAKILNVMPTANIIDVTHSIKSFDITQAAYILGNTYGSFPKGTIHMVVVNCFMDSKANFILVSKDGHYFLGPNNGVFSLIFPDLKHTEIREIKTKGPQLLDLCEAYSEAIKQINEDPQLESFQTNSFEFERRISVRAVVSDRHIRGTVIHIDHFENVVINVPKDLFENVRKGRNFQVYFDPKNPIRKISSSYSDVGIGEALCLFNSAGFLEIAVNMGKASSLLSLRKDETIQIDFFD